VNRFVILAIAACSSPGPEAPKPDSLKICDQSWEPHACLDAGHYYESQNNLPRATEMFDRGCKRQLFDACVAGSKYSLELAVPACDMGYEPACLNAAKYYDGDVAKSAAILDRLCKAEASQCGEAARILVDRDEPAALEMTRRACASPDRAACTLAVTQPFRHVAHREEVARLGCGIDLAESCYVASGFAKDDERKALLSRACKLKHAPACELLGKFLSQP